METAETPDEVDGVDAYHTAGREALLDDVQCAIVVFQVCERRDDYRFVGNIEIGIGSG